MRGRPRRLLAGWAVLAVLTALALGQESKTLSKNPSTPGTLRVPLPASGAMAAGITPGPAPEEGVLLLRNGEAIQGRISRVGELYHVALPGGQIRVKAADVDFCCRSLEEAYLRKRAVIPAPTDGWSGDVQAHLRLAQWCLRQNLLGPAGEELAAARQANPNHPMIAVLERRLQTAIEPSPQHPPAEPADQGPSAEELDRMVRDIPPAAVEGFTQTIQPLLLNHCGTAACHGPQSPSKLRLLRTPLGKPANRRLTQRNLQAVLAWVNREDPAASPLLTAPIQPHATATKPVFGKAQVVQYQRMVDWVHLLAKRPAAEVPKTVAPMAEPSVRAMPAELPGRDSPPPETPDTSDLQSADQPQESGVRSQGSGVRGQGPATGYPGATHEARASQQPNRRVAQQPDSALSIQHSAFSRLPVFVPVDPFDPEIFNRRYFGKPEPSPDYPSN